MKAKDFWEFLCEELDYRFFAGVPCKELKQLYDKMDARIMHYIPAVKENIALGLANGSILADNKAGILIKLNRIYNLFDWLTNFNMNYGVPILIIAYCDNIDSKIKKSLLTYGIPFRPLKNMTKDLRYITKKIEADNVPGILIIGKGVLEI